MAKRKPTGEPMPRKKACIPCSNAKVRCDQHRDVCTRCEERGTQQLCVYVGSAHGSSRSVAEDIHDRKMDEPHTHAEEMLTPASIALTSSDHQHNNLPGQIPSVMNEAVTPQALKGFDSLSPANHVLSSGALSKHGFTKLDDVPNFTELDLICTVNPEDIRNRWLKGYIPTPDQSLKTYSPQIIAFLSRILKSYSSMISKGVLPPFIHKCQLTASTSSHALSNCLGITRMCGSCVDGSQAVVEDTIMREIRKLYDEHTTYDTQQLLACFQAYLLYCLILYYQLDGRDAESIRRSMVFLQDIACEVSRGGLISAAEQQSVRPRWECWIAAEAARRTLFTMYLFDSVLGARDGLPTFLAIELKGIPAPASKELWRASTRKAWNQQFNAHIYEWDDEAALRIEELWPISPELSQADIKARRERVDKWLSSVDEYGTMLYAVTSCTHGT